MFLPQRLELRFMAHTCLLQFSLHFCVLAINGLSPKAFQSQHFGCMLLLHRCKLLGKVLRLNADTIRRIPLLLESGSVLRAGFIQRALVISLSCSKGGFQGASFLVRGLQLALDDTQPGISFLLRLLRLDSELGTLQR